MSNNSQQDNSNESRTEILKSIALLVVDAQDSFIDKLHNKEAFLLRCSFAIEAARALKIHTIFTEQSADKLGRTNAKLMSLAHQPKIFHKRAFSALNAPGIERYLRDREIYHLLVCGLETPICIYQTGLQAHDEDIDVTLLSDALGARRADDEKPALDALRQLGCQILPTETVLYSLMGDAQHPFFKAYNSVVKTYAEKIFQEADYQMDPQEVAALQQKAPEGNSATAPQGQPGGKEGRRERSSRSRRGRRRGGRGGRDREGKPSEPDSGTPPASEQPRPADTMPESTPPERQPQPAAAHSGEPPSREPEGGESSQAEESSAKKAPRKKRAAKKAAKKATKRAAKKPARQPADQPDPATTESTRNEP